MFLRDVLTRWNARPVDAAATDGEGTRGCRATPSLLEELAADPADFADLARALRLDLRAVVATLVEAQPSTPEELVARLRERTSEKTADVTASPAAASTRAEAAEPLVWTRVALDRRGALGTVHAGWLTPGAVEQIAGVAAAGGGETHVEITIALADDDARLNHVRELCAEVTDRLATEGSIKAAASAPRRWSSWGGGGEESGWGRWTRARGGARVHRASAERAPSAIVRQALVAP